MKQFITSFFLTFSIINPLNGESLRFFLTGFITILLTIIFELETLNSFAQTPTEQDCLGAIAICQNSYSESNAWTNTGNYPNEIDTVLSCLKSGERNDVWYTFVVQTSGNLCFTITPNTASDDYDWAVFNLTSANCSDIATNSSLEVSCNYAPDPGPTGPNGQAGNQNEPCIIVNAGEIYVINVSQFSVSLDGYTVDFSASTATIYDDVDPYISSVNTPILCGETSLTFTFSENVLCSTVQDGDFQLTGPGGGYTLSNVTGAVCSVGGQMEITFTVDVSPPITTGGTYNLCLVSGSGSVTDLCGNIAPAACLPFTVAGITVTIPTSTDINCFGNTDGSATAAASSGTPPYTYLWSNGDSTATTDSLAPGTYIVTVTDADGCSGSANVSISAPVVIPNDLEVTCDTACDGSASVMPIGGTSPYAYQWLDSAMMPMPGETDSNISNLCTGAFCVVTTDFNSCTDTTCIVIKDPSLSISPTKPSCIGDCDGAATVTAVFGFPPYTYQWLDTSGTPIPGQTDSILDSVCAGKYYLEFTTGVGCSITDSTTVTDPSLLTAGITNIKNTCFGMCNGTAKATPSGGTSPYTYQWYDPDSQITSTATGLCPGSYTVIVTDSKGCGPDTSSVTITESDSLILNITVNHTDCDTTNGIATINASGGATPYTYQWDDPGASTGLSATGLQAGTYNVLVTDSIGCTDTATADIGYLDSNSASINIDSYISCFGACDGEVNVTIIGGVAPYTYSWSTKDISASVDSACADTISVTATDSSGCPAYASIVLSEPEPIKIDSISSIDISGCGADDGEATVATSGGTTPYTYQWDDPASQTTITATGLSPGTYTVTVTDANDCPPDSAIVVITEPVFQIDSISGTDESSCAANDGTATVSAIGGDPPYTYLWDDPASQATATATGLSAGTYTVTVSDINGCPHDSTTIVLDEPPPITVSISGTDVSCPGGSDGAAEVTVTGGGAAPYTYLWSDGETTQDISGLSQGTYSVSVTDKNDCPPADESIVINEPLPLTPTISKTCLNGEGIADLTVTGGTPPYTYSWSNGAITEDLSGLEPGTYTVTVTDANNCPPAEASVEIIACSISVPNAFTPNGNGINDDWEIQNLAFYPDCRVRVYNRWGDQVFISKGYERPWDGKHILTRIVMPPAVYYYVIENVEIENFETGSSPYGWVTIVR
ncbi:MAG: gliding motility-associated C-terminal domain-containing protein [Bacteroidota bacterium]